MPENLEMDQRQRVHSATDCPESENLYAKLRDMTPALAAERSENFRPLDRRDNAAMLDILRQSPIESGGFSICFDRQPDIFAMSDLKYNPAAWTGFFERNEQAERDELAGFGLVGYHTAYVNAAVTPVMHITDCYIRPQSRGRGHLKAALEYFFDSSADASPLGYAIVMKGNRAAEAQLGDRLAPSGLRSRIAGELVAKSILLAYPRRVSSRLAVRRARLDDIPSIVALLQAEHRGRLFGLVLDCDSFVAQLARRPGLSIDDYYVVERNGRIDGVCAAWDTAAFKQNRVVSYGLLLNLVRLGSKLSGKLGGLPSLPAPGEVFRDVFLTDWATRDRSVEVMRALIEHLYREYRSRRYHTMIFGSCAQDPMLGAASGLPVSSLVSSIALLSLHKQWPDVDTTLPFIDLALL